METQRNEITVKINATMEEIHKIIKEKEYEEIDKFSLDDTYFIPENLDIEKISTREILAKALIIRWIKRDEKIIKELEKQNIPIFTDNYFVKKAEIELNKILNRK